MRTFADWARIAAALVLIILGAIVLLFYQRERFSFFIGVASIGVGLGFLWRSWNKK
jgi:UDP-N-acetylmuramyl pentapeptide phosphotransferase/UDP-N-acetylglucosamine-1-phosphate transferase